MFASSTVTMAMRSARDSTPSPSSRGEFFGSVAKFRRHCAAGGGAGAGVWDQGGSSPYPLSTRPSAQLARSAGSKVGGGRPSRCR